MSHQPTAVLPSTDDRRIGSRSDTIDKDDKSKTEHQHIFSYILAFEVWLDDGSDITAKRAHLGDREWHANHRGANT